MVVFEVEYDLYGYRRESPLSYEERNASVEGLYGLVDLLHCKFEGQGVLVQYGLY